MTLVIRDGRPYLYRSVRKGGKVTSEYAGSGEFASLAGRLEAIEREERRRQVAIEREERDRLDAEERPVAELFHLVELVARAALEAAGYHLHRRSEWRRRRTMKDAPKADLSQVSSKEILKRAQNGDEATRPIIRGWLAEDTGPALEDLDIARIAEDALAKSTGGRNVLFQEVIRRDLRALTERLAGPAPPPIEHLLARRVAVCWFAVNAYETEYSQCGSVTLAKGDYLQRRIDRAHRRLTTSLKTLATVRRMTRGGPLVAVNVEQSVTVEVPEKEEPAGSPALNVADLLRAAPMG